MVTHYAAHAVIESYESVALSAGLPVTMISFSDRETRAFLRWPALVRHLWNPLRLALRIRQQPRDRVLVLREFLLVPLLLGLPGLWPARRRLFLTNVHNLQRALLRWRDRWALKLLFALGFRFLFMESAAGLEKVGIHPAAEQVLVLPIPIPAGVESRAAQARVPRIPVVGVIGHARAEKAHGPLLERLQAAVLDGELEARVVVGCSTAGVREDALRRGCEAVDTSSREAYLAALRSIDVLVLNYAEASYRYRTSGVIVDAVTSGAAVVCPDLPVLRVQVTVPVTVGAVFSSLQELPRAVQQALIVRRAGLFPPREYLQYRSWARIGATMQTFLGRGRTASSPAYGSQPPM